MQVSLINLSTIFPMVVWYESMGVKILYVDFSQSLPHATSLPHNFIIIFHWCFIRQ